LKNLNINMYEHIQFIVFLEDNSLLQK